jgi:hypothetical protein
MAGRTGGAACPRTRIVNDDDSDDNQSDLLLVVGGIAALWAGWRLCGWLVTLGLL